MRAVNGRGYPVGQERTNHVLRSETGPSSSTFQRAASASVKLVYNEPGASLWWSTNKSST
eukprot:1824618-Pleurochrysis_carterae.AAC.1